MEVGTPLPPDLETIHAAAVLGQHNPSDRDALIARLHAVHHAYNAEHDALYTKQKKVKATLDQLYENERKANLASFDTVLKMGPARMTLERAKQLLEMAKDGLVGLSSEMAARAKKILDSGKDEE